METENRIQKYAQTFPPAVSGSGGQKVLWECALKLIVGYDLTAEQAAAFLLAEWNDRCDPPWSEREIRHTCENAYKNGPAERGTLFDSGTPPQTVETPSLVCSTKETKYPKRSFQLVLNENKSGLERYSYKLLNKWKQGETVSMFNQISPDCYVNNSPDWKKLEREWVFEYKTPDYSPFMLWYRMDYKPDENGVRHKAFLPFYYVRYDDGTGEYIEGKAPGREVFPFRAGTFSNYENLIFVEGEKAAAFLNRFLFQNGLDSEILVTCLPNGAGAWRDDLKEFFRGKTVFVWPDNDEIGKQYARNVCSSLEGVARSVRTLDGYPPGFSSHDDAVEVIVYYKETRGTNDGKNDTK